MHPPFGIRQRTSYLLFGIRADGQAKLTDYGLSSARGPSFVSTTAVAVTGKSPFGSFDDESVRDFFLKKEREIPDKLDDMSI
ncbi:hypothetical protein PI124_g11889 [Phytophthora idaei]|nr:hypothetical protein PI125_g13302 [Phytophthora idaei]KAG3152234.1 hypothetical protein PI126_g10612 [Phytophthora idaei]KAG3243291.1 hypothetical protein PI124_g11889 [Phytophthora idaei]